MLIESRQLEALPRQKRKSWNKREEKKKGPDKMNGTPSFLVGEIPRCDQDIQGQEGTSNANCWNSKKKMARYYG